MKVSRCRRWWQSVASPAPAVKRPSWKDQIRKKQPPGQVRPAEKTVPVSAGNKNPDAFGSAHSDLPANACKDEGNSTASPDGEDNPVKAARWTADILRLY